MPIIKSAQKRVRIAQKATIRNLRTKRTLKSAIKAVETSVKTGKNASKELATAYSELDKAVKKNIIHKNKAARKKSQLSSLAKKTTSKKSPAPKKSVAKKTPTKKPVAKKSVKKPTAKK